MWGLRIRGQELRSRVEVLRWVLGFRVSNVLGFRVSNVCAQGGCPEGLGFQMCVLKEGAMTLLSDYFSLEFSSRFRFSVWFLVCRV